MYEIWNFTWSPFPFLNERMFSLKSIGHNPQILNPWLNLNLYLSKNTFKKSRTYQISFFHPILAILLIFYSFILPAFQLISHNLHQNNRRIMTVTNPVKKTITNQSSSQPRSYIFQNLPKQSHSIFNILKKYGKLQDESFAHP